MEDIKELVYIVNRNKVKQIDVLDLHTEPSSKVNALYTAISNGEVDDDEAAFGLLYPHAKSRSAYRSLKSELRSKLLNTLFFIDAHQSGHSDREAAFYEAYKDFAAAQILLAKHARGIGIELLEKIQRQAAGYEFTELSVMVLRLLRLHYGTRLGDERRYKQLNETLAGYEHKAEWENRAELHYTDLVLNYVNNVEIKQELQDLARHYHHELAPMLGSVDTYKFHFYAGLVNLFQYTCLNDYVSTLPVTQALIAFFEQKPYTVKPPIQIFLHHQLVAYMQLRNFEEGQRVARLGQALADAGTFNWFKNLEYLFLLAMHTGNYQAAYTVFDEAVSNARFEFLPEQIVEMWHLYQAYLHLLIDQGHVLPQHNDKHFTAFRINRFLNNMPIYAKDKRGMNIAMLSVQILFYIQKEKYDIAIDRIEAIEKYCSRYLFKADTLRSYYFIKLLLAIPQAGFHRIAAERYGRKHLDKMTAITTEVSNQFHKIEIIPYEALWDMALNMLGTKVSKLPKRTAVGLESSTN